MRKFVVIILSLFSVLTLFSAVEFMGITGDIVDHYVKLSWSTATETENLGFILERKLDSLSAWDPLVSYMTSDALLGQGTISSTTNYSYTDSSVTLNETYYYRISGVDVANNIGILDSLTITVSETSIKESVPVDFNLKTYPNPLNPRATICFQLSAICHLNINIYNTQGMMVEELISSEMPVGAHQLTWDASNMPSGVYIIQIQAGRIMHSQKMVLMK